VMQWIGVKGAHLHCSSATWLSRSRAFRRDAYLFGKDTRSLVSPVPRCVFTTSDLPRQLAGEISSS
jgi:hypothetical protein